MTRRVRVLVVTIAVWMLLDPVGTTAQTLVAMPVTASVANDDSVFISGQVGGVLVTLEQGS